jgi:2-aminoadipate transaminase
MVFHPDLNPDLNTPLYQQLSGYFSALIDSGDLLEGERLPATRELAGQLGINRTTVYAAYELLEAKGLISGHVGRGSFVSGQSKPRTLDWERMLARPAGRSIPVTAPLSFAASRPPEELFPIEDFRRSCEEVLTSGRLGSILQLGSPGGYEPLRRRLFEDARQEGLLGPDDDLLITNGCQQALDLLRRVLVRRGMRVAVEDPVYPGLKNLLLEGEADLIGLPVGSHGIDPATLAESGAAIAILTSNFQNPTGLSLSLERRAAVLRAVSASGAVLIENDIYSALRYEGEALPSMKQMAPDSGTVLLRSFSKIAFPGLRLGWAIGPRRLLAAMRETKQLTDLHSDQFSQAVMLRFVESGRLAAHQANMIQAGRERRDAALDSAARYLPDGSRWTRPQGGLNFWVTLPERLDAVSLIDGAQRAGVAYLPGNLFSVNRAYTDALRISFGGTAPDDIRRGMEILGKVFEAGLEARRRAETEPAPAMV